MTALVSERAALLEAAKEIRDAFDYNPGHSDLDNEQPIHISTTLGAWRKLNRAIGELEWDYRTDPANQPENIR